MLKAEKPGPLKKICIFCGEKAIDKTREHVLSQWLIEYTGDPKRQWTFITLDPSNPYKTIDLSNFQFPACDACNNEQDDLEANTKNVVIKLDSYQDITTDECLLLLDWLDKVRIGLWLGLNYLSKNSVAISQKFFINQRMGMKDRVLIVYPYKGKPLKGMSVWGYNTPIFYYQPSAFAIKINGMLIINLSSDFLLAPCIKMPFPKHLTPRDQDSFSIHTMRTRNRFHTYPCFKNLFKPSIFVGQSIVDRQNIYSHFQSIYNPLLREGVIESVDYRRCMSFLFDFLKESYVHDGIIEYGEIQLHEATQFRNLFAQVYNLQEEIWNSRLRMIPNTSTFSILQHQQDFLKLLPKE